MVSSSLTVNDWKKWKRVILMSLKEIRVRFDCFLRIVGAKFCAWKRTALYIVCSELVGKEGDPYFWRFVEDWQKVDKPADPSDKDCVELIVKQGSALLGKTMSPLFHFSLVLRSLSPKVVLYRQLSQESLSTHFSSDPLQTPSEDPSSTELGRVSARAEIDSSKNPAAPQGKCCWVDVGTQVFLEESDLKEWLQSTKERWVGAFLKPSRRRTLTWSPALTWKAQFWYCRVVSGRKEATNFRCNSRQWWRVALTIAFNQFDVCYKNSFMLEYLRTALSVSQWYNILHAGPVLADLTRRGMTWRYTNLITCIQNPKAGSL